MLTIGVDFPFQKGCPECETVKPRSEFRKSAMTIDGLQLRCRACALRTAPMGGFTDFEARCYLCRQVRHGSYFKDISFQGRWRCTTCREKYDRERYVRLLEGGKCYRHRDREALPGRRACAECLEEDRAYSKRRRVAANSPGPAFGGALTKERQSQ
jgi:hypothetical protein